MEVDAYVAAGSNLGPRRAHLAFGLQALADLGFAPAACSSVWETEGVDTPEPTWFLNLVFRVRTALGPIEVLDRLLDVERRAGRARGARNAPRTLDLDLLLHGEQVLEHPRLSLPHPRMWGRRFVLLPLAEIAPQLRDPSSGRTVAEIVRALPDAPAVRRLGPLAPAETRFL